MLSTCPETVGKVLELALDQKSIKIFLGATGLAVVMRALLKVLFVDLKTGFYLPGGELLVVASVVPLVLGGLALVWIGWRGKDENPAIFKGNRCLECLALLLGLVLAVSSGFGVLRVLAIDPDATMVNQMPRFLQLLEQLLGVASGGIFCYLGLVLLSGAMRSVTQGMLALIPVLWQTLNMVDRFFSFRQVATVTDQTLEVLFMVCATLFFLSHTRCIANIPLSWRSCVARGMLTAMFGLTLCAGQLASIAVLGKATTGPDPMRLAVIGAISLYAMACAFSLALTRSETK